MVRRYEPFAQASDRKHKKAGLEQGKKDPANLGALEGIIHSANMKTR